MQKIEKSYSKSQVKPENQNQGSERTKNQSSDRSRYFSHLLYYY